MKISIYLIILNDRNKELSRHYFFNSLPHISARIIIYTKIQFSLKKTFEMHLPIQKKQILNYICKHEFNTIFLYYPVLTSEAKQYYNTTCKNIDRSSQNKKFQDFLFQRRNLS